MPDVKYLFFHTAAADIDNVDAAEIRKWHKAKGWSDIGYHYVIINDRHDSKADGMIEKGRAEDRDGAHVLGVNSISLGVCCVGHGDKVDFTAAQKQSLSGLLAKLAKKYSVPIENILGHREVNDLIDKGKVSKEFKTSKSCPGTKVDVDEIRELVRQELKGEDVLVAAAAGDDSENLHLVEALMHLNDNSKLFGNAVGEWKAFFYNGEVQGLVGKAKDL